MNEDSHSPHRSWLDRLTHAFSSEPRDREQLLEVLHHAKDHELLDEDALAMIEGVLKVAEMKVRDVMVPRAQMTFVEYDATPEQALPMVIDSRHSRFPVIGESRDEIIGILLAKDLLRYIKAENQPQIHISNLVRPAVFIPESKRLNVLLKEFRLNRNHMAIVIDEYGNAAGLITIEDVLEQIVGNIEDEFDLSDQEPDIKQLEENEYTVKALTSIDKFNEYFGTSISDEDFDTIGGYVMQQFGRLPQQGESINIDSFQATIMLASKRRIQLLRLTKLPHQANTE
jgi:magnesium and cobalt transporter